MLGKIEEVIKEMEQGLNDFTKDGKCSGCGQCCSALLPVSESELKVIKRYVAKHRIKPQRHDIGLSIPYRDLTCPFLDNRRKHKCLIYPVRPDICKHFICNVPPSKAEADKKAFWKDRKGFYMWNLFKNKKR